MAQFLWIPWRLPKLNELLDQRGRVFRKKAGAARASQAAKPVSKVANGYSVLKKQWEATIALLASSRGFSVLPGCWDFSYLFLEPNPNFDPSNISAAAVKFIEDALVKDKRLQGDGWATVHSITSHFHQTDDKCPVSGVLLAVSNKPLELVELLDQAGVMIYAERFHRRQRSYASAADQRAQRDSGNSPLAREATSTPTEAPSGVRPRGSTEDGGGSAGPAAGDR